MPSAKSRAAKAAIAARIANYNASIAALDSSPSIVNGSMRQPEVYVNVPGLQDETTPLNGDTMCDTIKGAVMPGAFTALPFQPTLPSMLNLNTSPNLNRALSVGAVTRKTDNASDEENVQPRGAVICPSSNAADTTQVMEDKGTCGRLSRPLSPILGNRDNERDIRAFEVERQKVKRAGELAKRKAKKAAKATGGVTVLSGRGRGASDNGMDGGWKSKARTGGNDMDVDVEEVADGKTKGCVKKMAGNPIDRKERIRIGEQGPSGGIEVNLSELFANSHRKPRKFKGMSLHITFRQAFTLYPLSKQKVTSN